MMRTDTENSFLPYHTDPLIPVRTVQRTLHLGEAMEWNLNLSIRFPSGTGVKAWLGNGSNDYQKKLETGVEDGYPTIYLGPEAGRGDHIYLEMEFGTYFAVNNITVCFASIWIVLLIILLMITLTIVKRIRKKVKKGKGGDKAEDTETEGVAEGSEENAEKLN
jgi:uncharacterized membrane protein